VEQIMKVEQYLDQENQEERVSHVVVMGIGEPLDNFVNLIDFLLIIKEHNGLAIAARRITVSTSGLADRIVEFADTNLQVNLAISLHAPNNELRSRIMKINRVFSIEQIMQAVDYYLSKTNRRITLEYILLKDMNDSSQHALELAELIGDRKISKKRAGSHANLLRYTEKEWHSLQQASRAWDRH